MLVRPSKIGFHCHSWTGKDQIQTGKHVGGKAVEKAGLAMGDRDEPEL